MSCSICGQDVPLVPTAEDAEIVTCMRCRAKFVWAASPAGAAASQNTRRLDPRHGSPASPLPASPSPASPSPASPSAVAPRFTERPPRVAENDDWDDGNQAGNSRELNAARSSGLIYRHDRPDFDSASAADVAAPVAADAITPTECDGRLKPARRPRSQWLQWTLLSLGIALFCCGATLVAWSFGDDHHHLWNIGVPLALAGQAVFLVGLVLQLEVIWQQSKLTSRRLENLDPRVAPFSRSPLTRPPALDVSPSITQSPSADAESLLKELKGQLDHVATRLLRAKW